MALNDDADDTPDSQPPLVRTVSFSLVMTSETETVFLVEVASLVGRLDHR